MDNQRDFNQDDQSEILTAADADDYNAQDDAIMDAHGFGTDERRMHVRAYNHWVMLLGDKSFPSVDDLDLDQVGDFVPNSVLLDFTSGIENPAVSHIGSAVAEESGIDSNVEYVSQIPGRSLLSRITDHYMEILANQAPIGFEAEFVNQLGKTIMYRGILLPFSSDDDTIDFVYGVINWKMLADKASTDELLLQVQNALNEDNLISPADTVWDNDEHSDSDEVILPDVAFGVPSDDADMPPEGHDEAHQEAHQEPPQISQNASQETYAELHAGLAFSASASSQLLNEDAVSADEFAAAENASELVAAPDAHSGLIEWLEMARLQAQKAAQSESRSRSALYSAIGLAYDVSLVAEREPGSLDMILDQAGIAVQERAPMTPIVKLVFGADYDKTRLTEYAAALSYAHRQAMALGSLPHFLEAHKGGLKSVVREERRLRRPEGEAPAANTLDAAYAALRGASQLHLDALDLGDAEFGVLVVRRNEDGQLVIAAATNDSKTTDMVVRKLV